MLEDAEHRAALGAECARVLRFAAGSRLERGGFGYLDERGRPDPTRPVETYVNARMTHVFALGRLLGNMGHAELVEHGVRALSGQLHDAEHGGWYAAIDPLDAAKKAYEHVFVLLAASSAWVVAAPGADELLHSALSIVDDHFWAEDAGMVVEEWSPDWSVLDPYRGANANMHAVEAFLAAGDVTGDRRWTERAERIARRLIHGVARDAGWLLPEHFDTGWSPRRDYNRDQPAHPFRPYGVTIGHLLEWSRLLLGIRAALGADQGWLLDDAAGLFGAAMELGWTGDGFVYTVDFDGRPVVRERMFWVVAEALAAAASLHRATADPGYDEVYARTWEHAQRHFADRDGGSWWHELDEHNHPAATVWPGKPDAYHIVQATLVPRLPLAPSLATALSRGLLES